MGKMVGIDLGTTNSVVAVVEGGKPVVIQNAEGNRVTPSVVAFTSKGDRLVGQMAKRQAVTNPRNTVFSIKRFMGRRHNEVESEEKMVPYNIVGGPDELVKVNAGDKDWTPPEVSAMILQSLKRAAEDYLGDKVEKAVITVPAYFNDSQRQATKDAGQIAGLEVARIINEPTAASMAYGFDREKDEKIAVFDFGGGTFDISILDLGGEGVIEVLATNGDTHLGGDDIDDILINYIADEFQKEHSVDLRNDQMALQRLKEAAEKAKCELSSSMQTDINLPFITADQTGPKHLQMNLTRARLEELMDPIIERFRGPCETCVADAKLKKEDIDEVVLVGGSTRIPSVQEFVKNLFGREPNKSVNPDEVVALGAAIQAGILEGEVKKDIVLLDVTPLSLGIETLGGVRTVLIEKNTTIPTSRKQIFSTAADSQPAVDIHVLQGEREMAIDNRTLGKFQLAGIPPAPRGMPQIEVTFDIDANGILNVSAKDLGTGKEQSIVITSSSGLSQEEVDKMTRDAESHADEDQKKRALIDARNAADHTVHETEKILKEHADKLSDDDKKAIDEAVEKLKGVKDGGDAGAITSAIEAVQQASQALGQKIYENVSKEQQAAGAGPEPSPQQEPPGEGKKVDGDDIIDADYEVKE